MKFPIKALPACAFLVWLFALPLSDLHAAKAPTVINDETGKKYSSFQAAFADAALDEPLTLKFSGTFRETVLIPTRQETTTIIGSGGKPTIDATGLNDAAIVVLSEKPVTLRGFAVTGGAGANVSGERRGGGIIMRGCERLLLVDMTIHGNFAGVGGGIEAGTDEDGGTTVLELAGKTAVRDNQATIAGAGISAGAGVSVRLIDRVSVRNNRFLPETVNGSGGGISISGSGDAPSKLEMFSKASVTGNSAPFLGGGIWVSGNVSVTASKNVLISGNTTVGDGGGVAATAGADLDSPDMTFACTFLNNLAMDFATLQLGRGGAIFCGSGALILQPGARVFANSADEGGGIAISSENQDTSFQITGAAIRGNVAEGNGGGISLGKTIGSIDESVIRVNRATRGIGGGISADSALLTLSNTLVTVNFAMPKKAPGSADNHGGGIAIRNNSLLQISGDSSIFKNEAHVSGGGISVGSDSGVQLFSGTRVSGNSAKTGSGGGIAVGGSSDPVGDSLLALEGAVTIAGNKAATDVAVPTRISGDEGEVPNIPDISDLSLLGNGGGIYFAKGKRLLMEGPGIVIQDNKGGRQKMEIFGGLMIGMGGGGVYAEGGSQSEIRLEGVDLISNSTKGSGGGLYLKVRAGASTSFKDVSVILNEAKGDGGGIYSRGTGSLTTTNLSLENNLAGHYGGGMSIQPDRFDETTTITMSGGAIADNLTTTETIISDRGGPGGGISARGLVAMTLNGVTVEDNLAADGGGGGIHFSGSVLSSGAQLVLSNCSIKSNVAMTIDREGSGGGLNLSFASCSLNGTTISDNETDQSPGAGIFGGSGSALVFGPGVAITRNRVFGLHKDLTDPLRPLIGGGIHGGGSISGTPQVSGNFPTDIFPSRR
jgi:predicted outer membrane repeat protein